VFKFVTSITKIKYFYDYSAPYSILDVIFNPHKSDAADV
jgi:hypothetical protein